MAATAPTNFGDFTPGEGVVAAIPGEGSTAATPDGGSATLVVEQAVPEAEEPGAEVKEEPGAEVEEEAAPVVNPTH